MSKYLIEDTTLASIADAIRASTGSEALMTPAEMATAISGMSSMRFAGSYHFVVSSSNAIYRTIWFQDPGIYCVAYASCLVSPRQSYYPTEDAASTITLTASNVSFEDEQGKTSSPASVIVRANEGNAGLMLTAAGITDPDKRLVVITVFGPAAVTINTTPVEAEEISDLTPRE